MKLSKFNTSISHEGSYVYHNSLTEKFLLLNPLLMDLIEAAAGEDNVEGLEEVHPMLYTALLESGFIVPKDTDEIQKVRELIEVIDGNQEIYQLMINPTMNCNFKCWYCYETHIKDSKVSGANLVKIKAFIDNVFNNLPKLKYFSLSFFGGEPLLYFDDVVVPIMDYARKKCDEHNIELSISFTTNGYLINEKMVEVFTYYKVEHFQISFDGNKEKHDKVRFVSKTRGSYDAIVNAIKLLVKAKINVALRINYTEENLVGLEDILDSFEDLNAEERKTITLSMNKVWQETSANLSPIVHAFENKAEAFGLNMPDAFDANTVKNSCYADKRNQAVINYNGDVYKCNARDFTEENREGYLDEQGNVIWNNRFEDRMNIKLKNRPCLECSILPICGGGCSQKAMEYISNDIEYCVNDFDESRKKELVLSMFLSKKLVNV